MADTEEENLQSQVSECRMAEHSVSLLLESHRTGDFLITVLLCDIQNI